MAEHLSALESVQKYIKEACDSLGYSDDVYQKLATIKLFTEVNFSVQMDDGSKRVFTGYRSLHNNALGPGKGGVRFHPTVTADEVKALSIWMSLKCALTDLPYGGGKGGVICEPKDLSPAELERLSRAYVRATAHVLGEFIDIPAPDVNTNGQVMSWMTDEYQMVTGESTMGTFTGKPVNFGGSLGREDATGLGVAMIVDRWAKYADIHTSDLTCAVQGFGNVGHYSMKHLEARGAKVLAVAHHSKRYDGDEYAIYNENGLSHESLHDWYYTQDHRDFLDYPDGEIISIDEFWKLNVDALIPAALEESVNEHTAELIKAKIIVEAANGAASVEGEEVLNSKGIILIPDILANGGGVIVSFYEWMQNQNFDYLSADEVHDRLEKKINNSYDTIHHLQEQYGCTIREAAYLAPVKRITQVMKLRGEI